MTTFSGFPFPRSNYSKLPHIIIDALPDITTLAELKIILYILRHTWGFQEFDRPKRITLDELCKGRRRRNRTRMDGGTGLSRPTVIRGIRAALAHGFIICVTDTHDTARIKKAYALRMDGDPETNDQGHITHYPTPSPRGNVSLPLESQNVTPEVTFRYPRGNVSLPRSEKETLERNPQKESILPSIDTRWTSAWEATKDDLQARLPYADWQGYIKPTTLVHYDPGPPRATILAPHQAPILNTRYLELLTNCTRWTFGQPTELTIVDHWQPPLPEGGIHNEPLPKDHDRTTN